MTSPGLHLGKTEQLPDNTTSCVALYLHNFRCAMVWSSASWLAEHDPRVGVFVWFVGVFANPTCLSLWHLQCSVVKFSFPKSDLFYLVRTEGVGVRFSVFLFFPLALYLWCTVYRH